VPFLLSKRKRNKNKNNIKSEKEKKRKIKIVSIPASYNMHEILGFEACT